MNRIVREHYPVERLPEDLREGFDERGRVRLVIEPEQERRQSLRAGVEALLEHRRALAHSADDAVQRMSDLRDEWHDPAER